MKEELEILVELARHDETWVETRRVLGEMPAKLAALARRMEDLHKGVHAAHAALEASRLGRRTKEGQAKDLDEEIRKLNLQLFQLKSNEAYTAMLKEIAAAQEHKSTLETEVLQLMDLEEQQQREVRAREAALAQDTQVLEAERRKVEQAEAALRARLAEVEQARQRMLERLSAPLKSRYERVFASKEGQAVGLVSHNACGGCHATLPPQLLAEVRRRDTLKVCETCGRLLAWAGA